MRHINLERATEDDSRAIWRWRNDPVIRNNFFDSRRISMREHARWYKERLNDSDTAIYVARYDNERIGVIRFEKKKGFTAVSVNVAPHLIGKGFGGDLIRLGTERYYAETKEVVPVIAKIRIENISSQKAFQSAGYMKKTSDKARVTFVKNADTMRVCDKEISLTPLREKHINRTYLKWLNDPEVTRYLETKRSTEKELRTYYERMLNEKNAIVFAIEVRRKHIGNAKLEINWKHGYASFGMMIGDKKQWGKGYGTRTAQLLTGYAFKRLGMHAVTLGVYGNHASAIKAYEKAGFSVKGRIPGMLDFEGNRVDKVIMGISSNEFCDSEKR